MSVLHYSNERTCILSVDGMFQLEEELPGSLAQLNTNSKLYIGQSQSTLKYVILLLLHQMI